MDGSAAIVLGLLPLLVFGGMVAALCRGPNWGRPAGRVAAAGTCGIDIRESMLIACVVCALWFVAGTELLGLVRGISRATLIIWWGSPALVVWLLVLRCGGGSDWARVVRLLIPKGRLEWGAWVPVITTVVLVALAGLVALLSPPNTFDAMRYHMPRQVGWMQQGSVAHLVTRDPNQMALPPLAEFMGLHLMVLSGGDFYATLVQWFALLIAVVAASLIARELGGGQVAQSMGAVLIASNPMAWLQASSAKNDLVAAVWVLIAGWVVVRALHRGRLDWRWSLVLGASVGLGVLTKATAPIYTLPLMMALGLWLLCTRKMACAAPLAAISAVALLVNAGHFARNMRAYGSPTANSVIVAGGRPLLNETLAPAAIVSNMVKNLALHAGTPWPRINAEVHRTVLRVHEAICWDPHDPRTSAYRPLRAAWAQTQEETAAAPIHILLLGAAVLGLGGAAWRVRSMRHAGPGERAARAGSTAPGPGWLLAHAPWRRDEALRVAVMGVSVCAGFVLFCAVLKWQPWHARLHLGLLALAAPLTSVVLCRGRGIGAIPVVVALLATVAPAILWNHSRPLAGPQSVLWSPRHEMLARRPHCRVGNEEVVAMVRTADAKTVGLALHLQGTYAMQRLLLRLDQPPLLTDPFAPGQRQPHWSGPVPEVIITDGKDWPRLTHRASGTPVFKVAEAGPYKVFAQREVAEQLYASGVIGAFPIGSGRE